MSNVMNLKASQPNSSLDKFLWLAVVLLLVGGVVANLYFSSIAMPIRIIGWIVVVALGIFIALQTRFGKISWEFLKEARMEMRKVTWPTRQETVQTTLVVIAMVVVMALILWGIDTLLLWGIGTFTGHAG